MLIPQAALYPLSAAAADPIPAFPGREGFGAETPGGRGGRVVHVTNLKDSGPGSLRDALLMTEPRIVLFKICGTIHLQTPITLGSENSYLTLAGQSAPGDGIAVSLPSVNGLYFDGAHDIVVRHLRVRGGERTVAILNNAHNIVLDHNSFTWSEDQTINTWGTGVHDVTISWNIIAEGGARNRQNAGALFGGGAGHDRIAIHHNYLAHHQFRNYMVAGHGYSFINNVNYNTFDWDFHIEQGYKDPGVIDPDIINHYFKEGPDSRRHKPFDLIAVTCDGGPMSIYLS